MRDSCRSKLLSDGVEALGFTGSKNEQESGMARRKRLKCAQHDIVFIHIRRVEARHGAGGDPNRARPELFNRRGDQPGRLAANERGIVFEIAENGDFVRRCADLDISFAILLALHENGVGTIEYVPEHESQAAISRQGFIGDAAVDDQKRATGSLDFTIKRGPDFGFEDDDCRWTDAPQYATDGECVVDWRVKNSVGEIGQLLFGDRTAGNGSDGDVERSAWAFMAQPLDQAHGGDDLAHRDRMQPDCARRRRRKRGWASA